MSDPLIRDAAGLEMAGHDAGLYSDLLHLFAAELLETAAELPGATDDEVGIALHRLKGAAAGVGAETLRSQCASWELRTDLDRHAIADAITRTADAATGLAEALDIDPDTSATTPTPADRALVLVVEDLATHRLSITHALTSEYRVMTASDGAEALQLLRGGAQPDLVLTDIRMPVMDGFELCRRLKSATSTREIPLMFITSLDGMANEEMGLRLGASDYVHKPISPALLRARVRNQIMLKQRSDLLLAASRADPLTGLGNRRQATASLASEWLRSRRSGNPMAVLMVDIDHFKVFNDSLGHLAGDECLVAVSTALSGAIRRSSDVLCRWGGEEFLAVLPDTDVVGGHAVGDFMVRAVSQLQIDNPGTGEAVTVSVGCASALGSHESWRELVGRADATLYRAKQFGRARCVSDLKS